MRLRSPTRRQIEATRAVVDWYLKRYFRTPQDLGLAGMFFDPDRVGAFHVDPRAFERGDPKSLFRLLVAMTMFQRRQDVQVLRILRGISPRDAVLMTDPQKLLRLAMASPCEHLHSQASLINTCDLAKDPTTKIGTCSRSPDTDCHLKRHTVVMKRYGHFGKVPTSAALMLHEAGAHDLSELRAAVMRATDDAAERARALEAALSRSWRVSDKIAAMFLSALCNPDLSAAPWAEGIDWTYFVVIDSNVDLFLKAVGYRGSWTYEARRTFIQKLAREIDLTEMATGVHPYNPRLVQQALYLFMSITNRREIPQDCMHEGVTSCRACPNEIARRCPARRAA